MAEGPLAAELARLIRRSLGRGRAPELKPGIDTVHNFDTPIDIGPARDPLWQPTPEPGEPPINAWELEGASSAPPVDRGDRAPLHEELQRDRKALRDGPAADRAMPQQSSQLTTKLTDVPVEPVRPRTQEKPGTGTKDPKVLEPGEPSMPGRLPALLGLGVGLRTLGLIGAVAFALLLAAFVAVGSGLARPSASPAPTAAAALAPAATLPTATTAAPTTAAPRQTTHPVGVSYTFSSLTGERCAPATMAAKFAGFYTQTTTAGDGTSTSRRVELVGGTLVGEIQISRYDPQSREPVGAPEQVVPFSVVLRGDETQIERVIVPRERMSRIVVTSWNGQPARANGLANLWVPACS